MASIGKETEMGSTISSRHRQINLSPIARVKYSLFHFATIDRASVEAIANDPLFTNSQGPYGSTPLKIRDVFGSGPPKGQRRRIAFGAGLVDRIVRLLKSRDIDVRGYDQPQEWSWAEEQPKKPRFEFLRRVDGRLRSLGVVPSLHDRISIIAELVELRPDSHVLVVVKTNKDAEDVGKRLKAATGRTVAWHPNPRIGHPWIHVISVGALPGWCVAHWGFIIFLDAELVLSQTAIKFISVAFGSVRVGFLTRDERGLHQSEYISLEALFGPVIYRPGNDAPNAAVTVAWLSSKNVSQRVSSNIVDRKRALIWANQSRNGVIARAARALSENNPLALKPLGLSEAASSLGASAQATCVAIVVENVEQGQQLARLLPGWRLEVAGYKPSPGQFENQNRVILTLARAAEIVLATTVTIYAVGGQDRWLEQVRLIQAALFHPTLLIVDVVDAHDERSRAETHSRVAEYRGLGFRQLTTVRPERGELQLSPGLGIGNDERRNMTNRS